MAITGFKKMISGRRSTPPEGSDRIQRKERQAEMNQDERIRLIVKGKLAEYYELLNTINKVDLDIVSLRDENMSVKAVSYGREGRGSGTMTNDERLAEYITRLGILEERRDTLSNLAAGIENTLHLNTLTEKERQIMRHVYNTDTYEDAGKMSGYLKVQVCRIMRNIYDYLAKYLNGYDTEIEGQDLW